MRICSKDKNVTLFSVSYLRTSIVILPRVQSPAAPPAASPAAPPAAAPSAPPAAHPAAPPASDPPSLWSQTKKNTFYCSYNLIYHT